MKKIEDLVGTKLNEDEIEQLQSQGVRVKRPGYAYTMDYNPTRANVHLDENNVVTRVSHG